LLAGAGYGLFPALECAVTAAKSADRPSVLSRLFDLVVHISAAGIPFPEVLEMVATAVPYRVLRHVLLHLDVSAIEGAELVPSLQSLSEHTHVEWRLSVEHRVRRLENWVVFPVFGAVIGLLLLVAAVPLVPLLEMDHRLRTGPVVAAAPDGGGTQA